MCLVSPTRSGPTTGPDWLQHAQKSGHQPTPAIQTRGPVFSLYALALDEALAGLGRAGGPRLPGATLAGQRAAGRAFSPPTQAQHPVARLDSLQAPTGQPRHPRAGSPANAGHCGVESLAAVGHRFRCRWRWPIPPACATRISESCRCWSWAVRQRPPPAAP